MNDTMYPRRWICIFNGILLAIMVMHDGKKMKSHSRVVMGYSTPIVTRHNNICNREHQQHQRHLGRHIDALQSSSTKSIRLSMVQNNYIVDNNNNSNDNYYWNEEQLMSYAYDEGIVLSISKVGPLIRTIARTRTANTLSSSNNSTYKNIDSALPQKPQGETKNDNSSSILLGYVEGFVRPTQAIPFLSSSSSLILHLDKMEVFNKQIQLARVNQPTQFRNGGTILGVGLLIGYLCVLDYVNSNNNKSNLMTEFLAIDDETYQHQRLVKYYTTAGFKVIKYVGDDFGDIPDRLIWGGCGTLLRQNCIELLQKWTKLLERSISKRKRKAIDTHDVQQSIEISK